MKSTNLAAYEAYIARHEAQYGKQPETVKASFQRDIIGKVAETIHKTKILRNTNALTVVTKDGSIYEYESDGWDMYVIKILVDRKAYDRYVPAMPYGVYIAG